MLLWSSGPQGPYLIPENTRGAARAKGQTAPTSEGGWSERSSERGKQLADGVDEDDGGEHEEGDDEEGDL